jgi:HSP20 family protein
MSALTRRSSRGLAEIFDWLEPPHVLLHPFAGQPMPIEERVEHGRYVVRAEMPGIDPEKQPEVTLCRGILTIHAERDPAENSRHSEFRYGSFTRHVALPESTDERDIEASYDNGIIEVSVGLRAKDGAAPAGQQIPVRLNQHIDPT